jgi:hypothetical protein
MGVVRAALSHSMRGYYIPLVAGAALAASAFLPWVLVGDTVARGVPGAAGIWTVALGLLSIALASASIVTRRNSRHPLLVVGLAALGVLFLAYQMMARAAAEHAWATSAAVAIVEGGSAPAVPRAAAGSGIYLGIAAAVTIALFGLTIVVKRVSRPYADPEDDVE